MKFIDSTEIEVRAGKGGRGLVSFHSGPNMPKGGIDGGDGGHGGDVYLVGDEGLNTLSHIRYHHIYKAEDGSPGGPNGRTGRCGQDKFIAVPLGTVAIDQNNQRVVAEVTVTGKPYLIAKGGVRGLGNMRFLRPNHQGPEQSTPGTPGEEKMIRLNLKLMADVGLAGFPNAGKSTLLAAVSAARPEIADYPFTTLTPQLGVVDTDYDDSSRESFVIADIPGLIEGAHTGKGLGLKFLKHLERTKVIAYVLDPFTHEKSASEQFEILKQELASYSTFLAAKPAMVILTKYDLALPEVDLSLEQQYFENLGLTTVVISAATHSNLTALKAQLLAMVQHESKALKEADPLLFIPTAEQLGYSLHV